MSNNEDDVSEQQGPPEGGGPPDFAGPVGDLPDKVPDHVDEIVNDKPESKGEGRLGMTVFDSSGDVKQAVEYRRLSGEGSVELRARENNSNADGIEWLKTRRDKIPRNK